MPRMKSAPLTVCVCADNADDCVVPLNQIAAGHVFGPHQHLILLLHGQDRDSLEDLALSIQESCYRLVDQVCVSSMDASHPPCYNNVTIVLLPRTHLPSNKPRLSRRDHPPSPHRLDITAHNDDSLPRFLVILTTFLTNKIDDASKVLVFGPMANTAATLLSRRLPSMGGDQLLAFQTEQNPGTNGNGGSQYQTADTMCHTVSRWWAGTKDTSKTMEAGIQFSGGSKSLPVRDRRVFCSVPVDVVGEKTFRINPVCPIDTEKLTKVVCETETALRDMQDKLNEEENEIKNFYYSSL